MKKHLELPVTISTQETVLLGDLKGWTPTLLNEKLESLELKGIIKLKNENKSQRKISLVSKLKDDQGDIKYDVDDKEKDLWLILENKLTKV